eukprot:4182281-Amphidinium_carterae.1
MGAASPEAEPRGTSPPHHPRVQDQKGVSKQRALAEGELTDYQLVLTMARHGAQLAMRDVTMRPCCLWWAPLRPVRSGHRHLEGRRTKKGYRIKL